MRDFAHQNVYSVIFRLLRACGGIVQIVYTQDARTDFDTKYVNRRVLRNDCLLGVAKLKFKFYIPFPPKKRHFVARF